jgi:hypothetical protein
VANELVVEVAPFTIGRGIATDALLEASDRLEREFLSRADGYVGRILVQRESTAWADIVFWRSARHAQQAMQAVASSEACRAYFTCMAEADHEDPGQGVTLFHCRRTYGAVAL